MPNHPHPLVGVVMGSESDWEPAMQYASSTLSDLQIPHEKRVLSAHRTTDLVAEYALAARDRGIQVIIAGAGGAAHLPGHMIQSDELPILGVPIESKALKGLDSLLSIVQMPAFTPVGTFGIGKPGAINAAMQAAQILALSDPEIHARLRAFRQEMRRKVLEMDQRIGDL